MPDLEAPAREPDQLRPPGTLGLVAGIVAAAAAGAVAVISFTPVDPPAWIRIGTFWLMLLGIPSSIVLGLGAKHDAGRRAGLTGAALGLLTLIALIVMQLVAG